ncbi:hypothetical protein QJS04_geneDACA023036 [Acorus gramineus]|uniref:Phytocyanin domain-containing protein n=1 Tax=Acorus gramineus TaxID=55184 RepID=A0AAV9A7Z2_ACOGR|nr:hypothetical protein QJS04_geneDACA023036 [Acorus gramineus]
MAKALIWSVVVVVLMAFAASVLEATTHVVGGSTGWMTPSDSKTYTNWAASQSFRVGDSLLTATIYDGGGRGTHLRSFSFHRRWTELGVVSSSWVWSGGSLIGCIGCCGSSLVLGGHM